MDSVLVHIGYPRAASTWLQRCLAASLDYVEVLDRRRVTRDVVLAAPFDFDAEGLRREIAEGTRLADARQPFISHERLTGSPHAGGVDAEALAARLDAITHDPKILIVVRRQADAVRSSYQRYIEMGGAASLGTYLTEGEGHARVPGFRFSYFEYDVLIGFYQQRFGSDRVVVLAIEALGADPSAWLRPVARLCGERRITAVAGPLNRSPCCRGSALQRVVNATFARGRLSPGAPFALSRTHLPVTGRRAACHTRCPLAARVGLATAGRFAESNRRTAELTGIDLGALGYEL